MKALEGALRPLLMISLAVTLCLSFSLSSVVHSSSLRSVQDRKDATTAQQTYPSSSSGFAIAVAYVMIGGGSGFAPPTFTYVVNGASQTVVLSLDQRFVNPDVGSTWSVEGVLSGSSSTERWATNQATAGIVAATSFVDFVYYHQYSVSFTHRVIGGGSPSPRVNFFSFGQSTSASSPRIAWADATSNYTYPSSISGSGSGERWVLNSNGFRLTFFFCASEPQ